MDLLWGVGCVHVGGWVRAAWLSVCLLCGQAPAVTFESTSARPTIAASTTNALMTACVWKVSPSFLGEGAAPVLPEPLNPLSLKLVRHGMRAKTS